MKSLLEKKEHFLLVIKLPSITHFVDKISFPMPAEFNSSYVLELVFLKAWIVKDENADKKGGDWEVQKEDMRVSKMPYSALLNS